MFFSQAIDPKLKRQLQDGVKQYDFKPETAPKKMKPFILGDKEGRFNDISETVSECFKKKVDVKEDYVFKGEHGGKSYFFKRKRKFSDISARVEPYKLATTTNDSPAYRVRKAEKIRKWVKDNNYTDAIYVPQKFLYWDSENAEWYSVAEAVDLTDEVVSVNKNEEAVFKEKIGLFGEGQILAYKGSAPQKDLTEKQARGLAELAFKAGYRDITYNNIFFDKQGRVAIIDTESVFRGFKKHFKTSSLPVKIINFLFNDWDNWSVRSGITGGTHQVKMFCTDEKALNAVKLVEIKHVLWSVALKIGKIALAIFAIKAIALIAASASVPALALLTLKIASIIVKLRLVADIVMLIGTGVHFYKSQQGAKALAG